MVAAQLQTIRNNLGSEPLGNIVSRFLDYLAVEAGLADNTLLAYGRDLVQFISFCTDNKIAELNHIRPETIYKYMRKLSKDNKSETSINRALVAIKMLIRFGLLTGVLSEDFTNIIEGAKIWQKLPTTCNKEKIIELLDAPDPEEPYYIRDKALLEILYATGCRASEAANLKISDINMNIGYLRCLGKGSKERIIPLGRISIKVTSEYLKTLRPKLAKPFSGDFLFLSRTGKPVSRVDIWRLVKKYAQRAGMPKNMTVHTIRHCFATHLLSGGADLRSLQEMLGHVDIATTQIYTHVDQERLKQIHRQFHPRA